MKKFVLLLLVLFSLSSCSWQSELDSLPTVEFDVLEYHRGGNITSTTIIAKGSKITNCTNTIDELNVSADYGPAVNFVIKLTGYKRQLKDCQE